MLSATGKASGTKPRIGVIVVLRSIAKALVLALLAAGCDSNAPENFFYEPRTLSEIVDDLVEDGQNVNDYDIRGNSLLVVAISDDDYATFKRLLDAGADPSQVIFSDEVSPQESLKAYAESLSWGEKYVSLLPLEHSTIGATLGTQEPLTDLSPLIKAVRSNDFRSVNALLNSGADIEATDPNGVTALHTAIVLAKYRMAVCLISKGASLSSQDNFGETPESTFLRFHADREFHGLSIGDTQDRMRWHIVLFDLIKSERFDSPRVPTDACSA